MRDFSVVIERDENGGLSGSIVELQGCSTQAKTIEELIRGIIDAIEKKLNPSAEEKIIYYEEKRDKETGEVFIEHENKRFSKEEWEQYLSKFKNQNVYLYLIKFVYPKPEEYIKTLLLGEYVKTRRLGYQPTDELCKELEQAYKDFWKDQYTWNEIAKIFNKCVKEIFCVK